MRRGKRVSHVDIGGKNVPGSETSECRVREVDVWLVCLSQQGAGEAGPERTSRRLVRNEVILNDWHLPDEFWRERRKWLRKEERCNLV